MSLCFIEFVDRKSYVKERKEKKGLIPETHPS